MKKEEKKRYVFVDKFGNKQFEYEGSFWGMIWHLILFTIGSCLLIAIIGTIVSGIASLF